MERITSAFAYLNARKMQIVRLLGVGVMVYMISKGMPAGTAAEKATAIIDAITAVLGGP